MRLQWDHWDRRSRLVDDALTQGATDDPSANYGHTGCADRGEPTLARPAWLVWRGQKTRFGGSKFETSKSPVDITRRGRGKVRKETPLFHLRGDPSGPY